MDLSASSDKFPIPVAPPVPSSILILTVDSLFAAADLGDVEQAKELRRKGMGINGIDPQGLSGN